MDVIISMAVCNLTTIEGLSKTGMQQGYAIKQERKSKKSVFAKYRHIYRRKDKWQESVKSLHTPSPSPSE